MRRITLFILALVILFSTVVFANAQDYYYKVKPGDTLWKIAKMTTGRGSDSRFVYLANAHKIISPEKIYAGQEIVLFGGAIEAARRGFPNWYVNGECPECEEKSIPGVYKGPAYDENSKFLLRVDGWYLSLAVGGR